jgi:acetyl esterase/lipase
VKRSTIKWLSGVGVALVIGVLIGANAVWWLRYPLVARFSPLPKTLSTAGRTAVDASWSAPQPPDRDVTARRTFLWRYQQELGARQQKRYPVRITTSVIAGVPVRLIRATDAPANGNLVLLNLHGGGWTADSGSLTENIPIASITKIPVVAVLYRFAPEHLFPAAVEDGLAVYRELLKTHKASEIGIYGTSAGAVIGPELVARIHREGLPEPGVFGMFSGDADLSKQGDTMGILPIDMAPRYRLYADKTGVTNPLVSPVLGPVDFFPPTLCVTSTRDFYMSSTANLCRALAAAGVSNDLVVFDGLPHAFWAYLEMPESDQAFHVMAAYFSRHLVAQAQP